MTVQRKTFTKNTGGIRIHADVDVSTDTINRVIWRPRVGMAERNIRARAEIVAIEARRLAPVGKGPTSGALANSIRVEQARTVGGQFDAGFQVTANTPYALFVHQGTRPHPIGGNPFLVFDWPKAGLFPAVFRSVRHPGTKGQPFLSEAMRLAVV